MTNSAPDPQATQHLARLAKKMQGNPEYLSSVLSAYQQQERLTDGELAHRLSLDESQLPRLALCKRPKADKFSEQVRQIAAYTGADVAALAQVIRSVEVLQQMRSMPPVELPATGTQVAPARLAGSLAAARDREEPSDEQKPEGEPPDDDKPEA